ncbi:Anaerobic dimethyl sulfoxide reductase chain B [Rubripirellula obstinata]|uniref:Anaerobic dimethyl sulfoxide reductase chain B n=1 Tax=Rubripirellula obstinata TaxID=406547 RepID=A0A5B1CJT5_9BACT|nr:DmsC/YnfH family molybdoenzyme membrane anchor subunit [Rubripirellula obstinata]KAA1260542.1 Anaerobic dimethyl sulfoxide reductase chain B [Rubripirellula obstinata]
MSSTLPITDPSPDLVGDLLREQQSLSAVERFSVLHEAGNIENEPAQARYYRDLLPASPPSPGQQFAFQVDLDKCSGCKACVVACHTLNGLEEDESWRKVGTITIGEAETDSLPTIQHVTTACHHCEDPGCLNGCPVKAYDKDPVTGIVRHLDDQCIGCKYCTMMCPYEVPKYSDRLGIVRKCDMCHQRLSAGEAPACVQACPNEAIAITIVDQGMTFASDERIASGAPLSSISKPTTQYVSSVSEKIASAVPQDAKVDHVAESHWPLAVMLVATQASVGIIIAERFWSAALVLAGVETSIMATRISATAALLVGGIGLNIAPLHLGQPLRAWRVFLGLKTSWLSREAIILGKYMGVLTAAVVLLWMPTFSEYVPDIIQAWTPDWAAKAALGLSIPIGIAGLYSSAMIYIVTRRKLWRHSRTFVRFLGTSVIVGLAGVAGIAAVVGYGKSAAIMGLISVAFAVAKLVWEYRIHLGSGVSSSTDDFDRRSHRLVKSQLSELAKIRTISGAVGIFVLLLAATIAPASPSLSGVAAIFAAAVFLASELAERWLYFSSVVYDRMPGTFK